MKRLLSILLLSSFFFGEASVCMAAGSSSENERLMQRAGELQSKYKDTEALALYEQVLSVSGDNYEALCKASYLRCRIGERFTDETSKLKYFAKAKEYALRAYGLQPLDAESNYVMALAMGCAAMVAGPKQRLTSICHIKPYLDIALSANNKHDGAWYLLGRWYFKIANLNIAEQAAAKLFFGGVHEKASNRDAVAALEKAIKYNPNNIRYYYDLALIYKEVKDKQAYTSTLQQALTLDLKTKEELELSRQCKLMLQEQTNS